MRDGDCAGAGPTAHCLLTSSLQKFPKAKVDEVLDAALLSCLILLASGIQTFSGSILEAGQAQCAITRTMPKDQIGHGQFGTVSLVHLATASF